MTSRSTTAVERSRSARLTLWAVVVLIGAGLVSGRLYLTSRCRQMTAIGQAPIQVWSALQNAVFRSHGYRLNDVESALRPFARYRCEPVDDPSFRPRPAKAIAYRDPTDVWRFQIYFDEQDRLRATGGGPHYGFDEGRWHPPGWWVRPVSDVVTFTCAVCWLAIATAVTLTTRRLRQPCAEVMLAASLLGTLAASLGTGFVGLFGSVSPVGVVGVLVAGGALLGSRPRRPAGGCSRCGYDLTGNVSGVCPECGGAVPGTIARR